MAAVDALCDRTHQSRLEQKFAVSCTVQYDGEVGRRTTCCRLALNQTIYQREHSKFYVDGTALRMTRSSFLVSKDDWFISLFIEILVTENFTIIACIVRWDDGMGHHFCMWKDENEAIVQHFKNVLQRTEKSKAFFRSYSFTGMKF
jgi:hypothetical protein